MKRRAVPFEGAVRGQLKTYNIGPDALNRGENNYVSDHHTAFANLTGTQYTESENHTEWKSRRQSKIFTGDVGGPFFTSKKYAKTERFLAYLDGEKWNTPDHYLGQRAEYSGPLLPAGPETFTWPPSAHSSDQQLEVLGTKAIAQCSPAKPTADISVAIGEIYKEGMPRVVGDILRHWGALSSRDRRRAIGSEYLNVEFGWKPLIRDIKKLAKAVEDGETIWAQYVKNAGKPVRRTYSFPNTDEIVSILDMGTIGPWFSPSSSILSDPLASGGKVVRTHRVSKKQWFSGSFMYFLPAEYAGGFVREGSNALVKAKKLYGLTVTPDTLWNLAPWSWAVDWFANVGDFLANVSNWAVDSQVLSYGYMMETSVSSYTYTYVGPTRLRRGGVRPVDVSMVVETKKRIRATPYGFGQSWDGFSTSQKAIIAALGLSRSR